ncbi:MAG: polymerase [Sphingobacteriaceae bacterium]|jgi:outer membrane translocation and assembly module TamA|nr:polymerase [Sphingobacteriaceae bacterium]
MRRYFALTICSVLFFFHPVLAQKKFGGKLLSDVKDTTRSSSFLPLPVIGYAQETGFEFGLVALYSFYTDRKDTLTRNSSLSGVASITTKKQSNFKLQADVWAPKNRYHYLGEIRYKNFPFNFYGTGDRTLNADKDVIVQKLYRLSGEVEKLIKRGYYFGLNAAFENYRFSDKEAGGVYSNYTLLGQSGGKVVFLGISQILDSRNTNTYTTKGSYLKVSYSFAPDFFGRDNYTGGVLKADFRTFKSLSQKTTLGLNIIHQSLQGDQSPFYLLPQLGNDQMMRGYYTGRYRDENLLAAQAEIRYRFIPRLGFVGFAGAGSVYQNNNLSVSRFKPSYGAGMRYFFDVERGLSIRLDYGFGEKRTNEERQKGFYVSLGEAF